MRWRPLAISEQFIGNYRGDGTEGYAITLRLKNHRHCNCLRSIPVVYVAEHHPSYEPWPMHFTASTYSAQQFLLNTPSLEVWISEQYLARHADEDLTDLVHVSYGYIIGTGR